MRRGWAKRWVLAACAPALGACRGRLPEQGTGGVGPTEADVPSPAAAGPRLTFDPPHSVDGASPITRFTIETDALLSDLRVILVEGDLSPAQVRDLARPVLPASLAGRAVPVVAWAGAEAGTIGVSPLAPLAFGGFYSIGLSAPPVMLPFQVAPAVSDPILARVWPPAEPAPSVTTGVWCGSAEVRLAEAHVTFAPAGTAGRFQGGTASSIFAPRCVSWVAEGGGSPWIPALSPPTLTLDDGTRVALEPLAMFPGSPPGPTGPIACSLPESRFGRGCAEVQDDRVLVRPPDDALLWTIDGGSSSPAVRTSRAGQRFVLRPLPPSGRYRVATLDRAAEVEEEDVPVAPGARRSHVVLNEVMANPAGSEPAQEWVELYNDGAEPQSLAGFTLDDSGGRTALPDAQLLPGAFALIVPDAFIADDGVDPPPAPPAQLLRVRSLGQGGLSNEGERLTLRDSAGDVVSLFPAMKTKNGVSIARVVPDALDDDPAALGPSKNGSATPGAPNGAP
jgi:hypothetical protein